MFLPSFQRKDSSSHRFGAPYRLGIEQEFDLLAGERKIDFRGLFPQIAARTHAVPFRNCDSAVILDAGYMLACDGPEAEFATAPINSSGDGCLALVYEVSRCRMHMLHLLNEIGVRQIRGYSTHLNISVPIGRERELAWAFATTVAPALILLMEAQQSPGLLLRPRRGRLEIGSEYLDDERQLTAAIVFLTGAVHAYLQNESLWKQFPQVRLKNWEEANIRPGIYLPHNAYGESMYELGRSACLELESGEKITAGELLETCAELVLRQLDGQISVRAGRALQRVVRQTGSLQIEHKMMPGAVQHRAAHFPAVEAMTLRSLASARNRMGVTPAFVDWEGVAFSWQKNNAPLVLGIPWSDLPQFFTVARKNDIPQYVATLGPVEPELTSLNQLKSPQAYARVDPVALGTQALNDKGMHAGAKGGADKSPKQFEYVDPSQVMVEQIPLDSGSQVQTIVARRQSVQTNLSQTLVSQRAIPSQGNPARSGWIGWVIGAVIAIVIFSLLAVGVGIVVLSHATQPATMPAANSESVPVFPQSVSTLTTVQVLPQIVSTQTLMQTPTPSCIPGPVISFPTNGMTLITRAVRLQWNYTAVLSRDQVFAVLLSSDPNNLQGPNSNAAIVAQTVVHSVGINLPYPRNFGNIEKLYWLVRIMDSNQQFIDCPVAPSYFYLNPIPASTATNKPTPMPKPTQKPTLSP